MEHKLQKYFLLTKKQIGRKQNLQWLSKSTASTVPPQCGHSPGACFLPNSLSSHPNTEHIFSPLSLYTLLVWNSHVLVRSHNLEEVFIGVDDTRPKDMHIMAVFGYLVEEKKNDRKKQHSDLIFFLLFFLSRIPS